MGSNDEESDKTPLHKVCLDDFYMDKYEVTQVAYKKATGQNPSRFGRCPTCPVERITWDEANAYCAKAGKRLPTEAEWEYSARSGGKNVPYATQSGNLSRKEANYGADKCCNGDKSDGYPDTSPVGSYPPNGLGLYDMSGNVIEWVADRFGADYYRQSPEKNPKGPTTGEYRVLRGGSWNDSAEYLTVTIRDIGTPGFRNPDRGFRCAQPH